MDKKEVLAKLVSLYEQKEVILKSSQEEFMSWCCKFPALLKFNRIYYLTFLDKYNRLLAGVSSSLSKALLRMMFSQVEMAIEELKNEIDNDKHTDNLFDMPSDAKWSDVQIKFIDGHTVSVKVKEVSGKFNYTQMGMVDNRNGNPTVQWELLRSFASGKGTLNWDHPDASHYNKKRKELLAKNLRGFFCIEEDPFRLTNDLKGWEAKFRIIPD